METGDGRRGVPVGVLPPSYCTGPRPITSQATLKRFRLGLGDSNCFRRPAPLFFRCNTNEREDCNGDDQITLFEW